MVVYCDLLGVYLEDTFCDEKREAKEKAPQRNRRLRAAVGLEKIGDLSATSGHLCERQQIHSGEEPHGTGTRGARRHLPARFRAHESAAVSRT